MKPRNEYRLYNLLLPLWLIVWVPGLWWLLLIPANYALDFFVLRLGMKKKLTEYKHLLKKYAWRTWLFGFLADFLAVLPMGVIYIGLSLYAEHIIENGNRERGIALSRWANDAMLNVWHDPISLLIAAGSVLLGGWLVYVFNRRMLAKNAEIGAENARYIAKRMALFTAPYLYLIPVYFH